MSYTNKLKEQLAEKTDARECCKATYIHGLAANSKNPGEHKVNREVFVCPECKKSFFRGLFISSGNISDPKVTYHLEFAIFDEKSADDIKALAISEDILFKQIKRRNKHVLYLKSSEQIEDFLYYINAQQISFELMETKILKDLKNNANRVTNFENANLEKVSKAAAEQIKAVELIIKKGRFDSLPEELKQTARLRLEYIELSLREIGEMSKPPVSKSGITHRMQRIIDFARELK